MYYIGNRYICRFLVHLCARIFIPSQNTWSCKFLQYCNNYGVKPSFKQSWLIWFRNKDSRTNEVKRKKRLRTWHFGMEGKLVLVSITEERRLSINKYVNDDFYFLYLLFFCHVLAQGEGITGILFCVFWESDGGKK